MHEDSTHEGSFFPLISGANIQQLRMTGKSRRKYDFRKQIWKHEVTFLFRRWYIDPIEDDGKTPINKNKILFLIAMEEVTCIPGYLT